MTGAYTFSFKVSAGEFRKALYFNTFAKAKGQIYVIAAVWLLGLGLVIANLAFGVPMSNVMQMCYVVICAAAPLLVFSCERGWRQYRESGGETRERAVSISDGWVKLRVSGDPGSEKLDWRMIAGVYELTDMFIIYRDANLMVVLPKSEVNSREMEALRKIFVGNLGRGFHRRCAAGPMALVA